MLNDILKSVELTQDLTLNGALVGAWSDNPVLKIEPSEVVKEAKATRDSLQFVYAIEPTNTVEREYLKREITTLTELINKYSRKETAFAAMGGI